MNCQAILFDLDGTLLDSLDDLHDAVNRSLAAFGFPLRTREETRLSVGNGVGRLMALSLPGGENNRAFADCLAYFRKDYGENSRNKTRPYDGVLPLLTALREKGIFIGVVSNKFDSAVKALCSFYFPGLVDIAVGEREGIRRKPAPDALLWAIGELGVSKERCLYVGDSETDILTAKNASLPCLSALWGFRDRKTLEEAGGTVFLERPDEVLNYLFSVSSN